MQFFTITPANVPPTESDWSNFTSSTVAVKNSLLIDSPTFTLPEAVALGDGGGGVGFAGEGDELAVVGALEDGVGMGSPPPEQPATRATSTDTRARKRRIP